MAVTILFNVLKALSRFRLWRIDAAREKLETALKELVDHGLTHAQMRSAPADGAVVAPKQRAVARSIMEQLMALRARCQRQVGSIVTPNVLSLSASLDRRGDHHARCDTFTEFRNSRRDEQMILRRTNRRPPAEPR
jgi:hypothetical protein